MALMIKIASLILLVLFLLQSTYAISATSATSSGVETGTASSVTGQPPSYSEAGLMELAWNGTSSSFSATLKGSVSGHFSGFLAGQAQGSYDGVTNKLSFTLRGIAQNSTNSYDFTGKAEGQLAEDGSFYGEITLNVSLTNGTYIGELSGNLLGGPGSYVSSTTYSGGTSATANSLKVSFSGNFTGIPLISDVFFEESGLPDGALWQVNLTAKSLLSLVNSSRGNSVDFKVPRANYSFSVFSSGYSSVPSRGQIQANQPTVVVQVLFFPAIPSSGLSMTASPSYAGASNSTWRLAVPMKSPGTGYFLLIIFPRQEDGRAAFSLPASIRASLSVSGNQSFPKSGQISLSLTSHQLSTLLSSSSMASVQSSLKWEATSSQAVAVSLSGATGGLSLYGMQNPQLPGNYTLEVALARGQPGDMEVVSMESATASFTDYENFPPAFYGLGERSYWVDSPSSLTSIPSTNLFGVTVSSGSGKALVQDNLSTGEISMEVGVYGIAHAQASDLFSATWVSPTPSGGDSSSFRDVYSYKMKVTTVICARGYAGSLISVGWLQSVAFFMLPNGTVVQTPAAWSNETSYQRVPASAELELTFPNPFEPELFTDAMHLYEYGKLFSQISLADSLMSEASSGSPGNSTGGPPNIMKDIELNMNRAQAAELATGTVAIETATYEGDSSCFPGDSITIGAGAGVSVASFGLSTTDLFEVAFVQIEILPGDIMVQGGSPFNSPMKVSYFGINATGPIYDNEQPMYTLNVSNINTTSTGSFTMAISAPYFNSQGIWPDQYTYLRFSWNSGASPTQSASAQVGSQGNAPWFPSQAQLYLLPGHYEISASYLFDPQTWPYAPPPNLSSRLAVTVLPEPSSVQLSMKGKMSPGSPITLSALLSPDPNDGYPPIPALNLVGNVTFLVGRQVGSSPVNATQVIGVGRAWAHVISGGLVGGIANITWIPKAAGNYTVTAVYSGDYIPVGPTGSGVMVVAPSSATVADVAVEGSPSALIAIRPQGLGGIPFSNESLVNVSVYDGWGKPVRGAEVMVAFSTPYGGFVGSQDGAIVTDVYSSTNAEGWTATLIKLLQPSSRRFSLNVTCFAWNGQSSVSYGSSWVLLPYQPPANRTSVLVSADPNVVGKVNGLTWTNSSSLSLQLQTYVETGNGTSYDVYPTGEQVRFAFVTSGGLTSSAWGFSLSNDGLATVGKDGFASVVLQVTDGAPDRNMTLCIAVENATAASVPNFVPFDETLTVQYRINGFHVGGHHCGNCDYYGYDDLAGKMGYEMWIPSSQSGSMRSVAAGMYQT